MRGPKANGFASQWNICFRVLPLITYAPRYGGQVINISPLCIIFQPGRGGQDSMSVSMRT